jgi:hypothetical protein
MKKSITHPAGKNKTTTKKSPSRAGKRNSPGIKDSPANKILSLQKTIGNKAVQRLLHLQETRMQRQGEEELQFKSFSEQLTPVKSCPLNLPSTSMCPFGGICDICPAKKVQAKLTINRPGDRYEQEADRVADQVMSMPEPDIQRECPECPDDNTINRKSLSLQLSSFIQKQNTLEEEEEEPVQTKTNSNQEQEASPALAAHINSIKSGGQPLNHSIRSYFEPRFSARFNQVRVHTGTQAAQVARSINARAFTVGKNIIFGQGQYSPQTATGRKLMAHELTHVIQQTGPS